MKILTSGFYDISHFTEEEIYIGDGSEVILFDTGTIVKKMDIGNDCKVYYYGFFVSGYQGEKHIILSGKGSRVESKVLNYTENNSFRFVFLGQLANSLNYLDIDIIALVGEMGSVDIDGRVQIDENIEKVEGYLHQTNIFLSDTGKARGIPTLLVRSNDVKAAHGCNIERISDDKLFYMRSRGIEKEIAIKLMIGSYFERVFGDLRETQSDFVDELFVKFEALI